MARRPPPRSIVPTVIACALGLLLAVGCVATAIYSVTEIFVDVGVANVCAPGERHECFTNEPGFVVAADSTEMQVRPVVSGQPRRVVASTSCDDPPAPRTVVTLQRWEGGEIGYVVDPVHGRRYDTSGPPDRGGAVGGAIGMLLLALLIVGVVDTKLRGY